MRGKDSFLELWCACAHVYAHIYVHMNMCGCICVYCVYMPYICVLWAYICMCALCVKCMPASMCIYIYVPVSMCVSELYTHVYMQA